GRHLRDLQNSTLPAGSHSVEWDGRNDGGENVPSGIYFARIDSDFGTATMKMTMLK
ncbi:hypothetical protein H8E52_10345, partial [bacterium]|nr:hypothetical protein [bacterium]